MRAHSPGSEPDTKILVVDLRIKKIEDVALDGPLRHYLGGRLLGLGLWNQYRSQNPLVFASAPTNRLRYKKSLSGRTILVGKSPLTKNIYSSNSGGPFGSWIAREGYAAVVLLGASDIPVYLDLSQREITTVKPEKAMIAPLKAVFAGCRYAMLKDKDFGTYGRGGFGKAFVDKNLLGLAYGDLPAEKTDFPLKVGEFLRQRHASNTRPFQDNFNAFGVSQILVQNNWRPLSTNDDLFVEISKQIESGLLDRNEQVTNDEIRFGSTGKVAVKLDKNEMVAGPQNQTAELLGPNLGIGSLQEIYNLSYLCDQAGVDALCFGAVMAAAMDMFEDKVISVEQTDGLNLCFGSHEAVKACLEKICDPTDRSKFTNSLRQGVKGFCDAYGAGEYAMQTKGLSFTAYNVINNPFLALLFATSIRGPDHFRGGGLMRMEGKDLASAVINNERNGMACDILGLDRFSFIGSNDDQMIECARHIGLDVTSDDLDYLARQTLLMERMLFFDGGGRCQDDTLPLRILKGMEAVSTETFKKKAVGPLKNFQYDGSANLREFFNANLMAYYQNLNLDSNGIPKAETLTKYGLLPPDQATSWYIKIVAQQNSKPGQSVEGLNHAMV
jgi:aldehyde:ferredoxin oxidoreductase